MGIWRKISLVAIDKPKLHYVKSIVTRTTQNGDWQIKIEAICDMPTTNQGDYGMLHVTLVSHKDGRKLLIDENFSVDMNLIDDGMCTSTLYLSIITYFLFAFKKIQAPGYKKGDGIKVIFYFCCDF